jgi:hypothetical protein
MNSILLRRLLNIRHNVLPWEMRIANGDYLVILVGSWK